jgi:hypothetical protein
MAWYSWFKSSDKAIDTAAGVVEKVSDGLYNGIDMAFYTDEEKAIDQRKKNELIYKFWELTTKENTQQSLARRELAKMTMKVYFSLILMAVSVWGFDKEYAEFIFKVVGTLSFLAVPIGAIYFGPHQFAKLKDNG